MTNSQQTATVREIGRGAIGLASDHAGFPLKEHVKEYLKVKGLRRVAIIPTSAMPWELPLMPAPYKRASQYAAVEKVSV